MEMSQSDALRPVQVSQARRVSLRHGDDASRVVILHDAVHWLSKHGLEEDLKGGELLFAAVRKGHGLGLRGVHRRRPLHVGAPGQGEAPPLASSELGEEAVRALRGHEVTVEVSTRPRDGLEVLPVGLGERAGEHFVRVRVQVTVHAQQPAVSVRRPLRDLAREPRYDDADLWHCHSRTVHELHDEARRLGTELTWGVVEVL